VIGGGTGRCGALGVTGGMGASVPVLRIETDSYDSRYTWDRLWVCDEKVPRTNLNPLSKTPKFPTVGYNAEIIPMAIAGIYLR